MGHASRIEEEYTEVGMQLSFKKAKAPRIVKTMADLRRNEEATLDRIDLPAELAERLMELGFVPGHAVSAVHSAPSGDPRVFRVDGTEIALRRETAVHMLLRKH
jgi:Fe2+ transport system protein FeoA